MAPAGAACLLRSGAGGQRHGGHGALLESWAGRDARRRLGCAALVSANLHGGSDDELYANPLPPTQTRLAIWQPHRLCGVEASGTEGRFTIPSIFRKSEQLRLNYRCEAGVRAPSIPNQSWGGADL